MHVAQINFLAPPRDQDHAETLERWHSLVDIAEIAASGGLRVSVVQAAWRNDCIHRNGIDYHFVDLGGAGANRRAHRIARKLAEVHADLLHAHGLDCAGQALAVARRFPALPVLCQDHANQPPRRWRRRPWRRWFARVDAVTFTAAEQARPFVESGIFTPPLRVLTIAESSSRFSPGAQQPARAETGLHGDPCVLWIGHLAGGKDPLAVLEGVARAAAALPDLQLWCAYGSAPLIDAVRERVRGDPRLAQRVHLLGQVAHPRIQTLLRAADLFVSGSHAESTGYALLEALACGTPPVVTDIPAFRALTGHGRIGWLWPAADTARLAQALVEAATERPSRNAVRAHFEAELSFPALGRRWAQACTQVRELHVRRRP